MRGTEHPGAGHDHVLPVADGRLAEPGGVQALPGPDQHLVALRSPEQFGCGFVQYRGVVAQRLGHQGLLGVALRPRFEQRVGGGAGGAVKLGGRDVPQDQAPDNRVHQHGTRRAGRVDRQQAQPVQVVHGIPDLGLFDGRGVAAGDVTARGGADDHRARDSARVHHRGQHQGGRGQARREKLAGALDRQRPGHVRGRGRVAGRGTGETHPAVGEPEPVLVASQARVGHQGGGLRQGERMAAEVGGEVERLGPLAGIVVHPGGQVGQRLTEGERADRDDPPAGPAQRVTRAPGGDHDPARRAQWPQPRQVGRVSEIIEDHQPRPAGLRQPGQEPCRAGLEILIGVRDPDVRECLRVGRHDGVPAERGHPDQQVYRAVVPEGVRQRGGELCLAGAAQPVVPGPVVSGPGVSGPGVSGLGVSGLGVSGLGASGLGVSGLADGGQHHRLAANHVADHADPALGPGRVAVGQRRYRSRPDRPAHGVCSRSDGAVRAPASMVTNMLPLRIRILLTIHALVA